MYRDALLTTADRSDRETALSHSLSLSLFVYVCPATGYAFLIVSAGVKWKNVFRPYYLFIELLSRENPHRRALL